MSRKSRFPAAQLIGCVLVTLLTACGFGASEPGRFYVLSPPPDISAGAVSREAARNLTLGVGPIGLPPHLDRTQIVTQKTRHRLDMKEIDQWAEPLKAGLTRVLAQNLSALLGTDRVFQFPWRRPITVQYQVTIDVQRFNSDRNGDSILSARWSVIGGDGRELLYSRTSTFQTTVSGQGVEPVVAAMSANVAELSREIATGIVALSN